MMHFSFDKAADLMGISTQGLIRIPVDCNNRVEIQAMRQAVTDCQKQDLHIIAIVGIAGATDSGSVDPLEDIAEIAEKNNIHFHVDAAWGGRLFFPKNIDKSLLV